MRSFLASLSNERQTILFVAASLAIFLLITGLFPDLGKTRTPLRGAEVGKRIPVAITLVTADFHDLACAGDQEVAGARCAFDREGRPRTAAPGAPVLAPYMTVDDVLFLIPDLWSEPALARRLETDPPDVGRDKLRRFVARCEMTLLGKAKDFYVRWTPNANWSHRSEAWVGRIADCSIE